MAKTASDVPQPPCAVRQVGGGDITRRRFFSRAGTLAAGGLAAGGLVPTPAAAAAQQPNARPANWLSLTTEEVIEPRLPIIDPHHHLWGSAERPLPARRARRRHPHAQRPSDSVHRVRIDATAPADRKNSKSSAKRSSCKASLQ